MQLNNNAMEKNLWKPHVTAWITTTEHFLKNARADTKVNKMIYQMVGMRKHAFLHIFELLIPSFVQREAITRFALVKTHGDGKMIGRIHLK